MGTVSRTIGDPDCIGAGIEPATCRTGIPLVDPMAVCICIYPGSPAILSKAVDVVKRHAICREVWTGQEEIDRVTAIRISRQLYDISHRDLHLPCCTSPGKESQHRDKHNHPAGCGSNNFFHSILTVIL